MDTDLTRHISRPDAHSSEIQRDVPGNFYFIPDYAIHVCNHKLSTETGLLPRP